MTRYGPALAPREKAPSPASPLECPFSKVDSSRMKQPAPEPVVFISLAMRTSEAQFWQIPAGRTSLRIRAASEWRNAENPLDTCQLHLTCEGMTTTCPQKS